MEEKILKKAIKAFSLATLFLGSTAILHGQQTIHLGEGGTSNSSYTPLYYLYHYNYSQVIYEVSELIDQNTSIPAEITKIWYLPTSSVSTSDWEDWVVYMGNTTKDGFESTTDWVPFSDLQEVFDGKVISNTTANEWIEIELDTPFQWDGTSNIVIAVDENTPGWGSNPTWSGYALAPAGSGNKGIYYYSNGTNPDPQNPPTASGRSNTVAQVRLTGFFIEDCATATLPNNITAIASADTVCQLGVINLTIDDPVLAEVDYLWECSTDGGSTWTDIGTQSSDYSHTESITETTLFRVKVLCDNTVELTSDEVEVYVNQPGFLEVYDGNRCGDGEVVLHVQPTESTTEVNWYASETDDIALGTGNTFITDPLTDTDTFWAEASTGTPQNETAWIGDGTTICQPQAVHHFITYMKHINYKLCLLHKN